MHIPVNLYRLFIQFSEHFKKKYINKTNGFDLQISQNLKCKSKQQKERVLFYQFCRLHTCKKHLSLIDKDLYNFR